MQYLIGIIFIIIGALSIYYPKAMILFDHKFTFKKGAEPTDTAIAFKRITGVIAVIIGLLILFGDF